MPVGSHGLTLARNFYHSVTNQPCPPDFETHPVGRLITELAQAGLGDLDHAYTLKISVVAANVIPNRNGWYALPPITQPAIRAKVLGILQNSGFEPLETLAAEIEQGLYDR